MLLVINVYEFQIMASEGIFHTCNFVTEHYWCKNTHYSMSFWVYATCIFLVMEVIFRSGTLTQKEVIDWLLTRWQWQDFLFTVVFRVALGHTLSYPRDTQALLPLYSEGEIKEVWSFTFLSPLIWSWIAGTVLPLLLLSHFIVAIFSSDRNFFIIFFKEMANKNLQVCGRPVAPKLYRITNAKWQLFLALHGRGI